MNIKKTGVLLCLLGLMTVSYGCGDDKAVPTNAEAQGLEANVSEENQKGENQTVNSPENDQESSDDLTEGGPAAEPIVEEPLKSQLTAELLEENELDTGVVENTRTTKGCTFTLPEEFEASEDVEGMYVTGRYPIDASTIYYTALEQDMALQLMTKEAFKAQVEESLRGEYGQEIEVSIDSYERIKIQSYPAFRIKWHCQVEDVNITQLACAVNADKVYVITYSQTGDYDRMEAYEASAETIKVE